MGENGKEISASEHSSLKLDIGNIILHAKKLLIDLIYNKF